MSDQGRGLGQGTGSERVTEIDQENARGLEIGKENDTKINQENDIEISTENGIETDRVIEIKTVTETATVLDIEISGIGTEKETKTETGIYLQNPKAEIRNTSPSEKA